MTGPLTSGVSSDVEPREDADDLVGGGRAGSARVRWALVALVVVAVAGSIYFAVTQAGRTSTGAGEVINGGDLGEQNDAKALSERLAPELAERPDSPPASLAPGSVRCDDSAAALPQDQAELVYSARLEWEGTPAVVLGYRVEGPSLSRVLLVMAEEDCRLIVTQSF